MDADVQRKIQRLNREKVGFIKPPFNTDTRSFLLPKEADVKKANKDRQVALIDTSCSTKTLIFKALYTMYYRTYFDNDQPVSRREYLHRTLPMFMQFLNVEQIVNKYKALKQFEAWRLEQNPGISPQSTGLRGMRALIKKSLDFAPFMKELSVDEIELLKTLARTKLAPADDTVQVTLTNYFSQSTWLRRDDVGVGNALFNRLASPRLLVQSMRLTTAVALLAIHKAKHAIIDWAKAQNIQPKSLAFTDLMTDKTSSVKRIGEYRDWFNSLKRQYQKTPIVERNAIDMAMDLIIYSHSAINLDIEEELFCTLKTDEKRKFTKIRTNTNTKKTENVFFSRPASGWLFDAKFVSSLIDYAHSQEVKAVPSCDAEHVLFHWLMAMQATQPTDINKLRLSDFRFAERQNGTVESIECTYWKSRAKFKHSHPSLNTREVDGKAVLAYLNDRTGDRNLHANQPLALFEGLQGLTLAKTGDFGRLVRWMKKGSVYRDVEAVLEKNNASPVFIDCLFALVSLGNGNQRKRELCELKSPSNTFGMQAVKNSSIHANSDDFDPSKLVNYNSHSNETERHSYLSEQNEEWLNNCGRITRAIMNDLRVNVFSVQQDRLQYNSDFTHATEHIERRRDEVLAVLKIISKRDSGDVKNISISDKGMSPLNVNDDIPDTRYIVDCPESVMRIKHYIAQADKHHNAIAQNSPEFLFYELLPTVEWMENLLSQRKFSKDSVVQGEAMFSKYKSHLPPLFTPHVGGFNVN